MDASLVIPCFNEEKSIEKLALRCQEMALACSQTVEIVLVDNGSTDDTPDVLTRVLRATPNVRSVRVDVNQGYGHGILFGLQAAKGAILGWTHADLQTDPMDFKKALDAIPDEGGETVFVKGARSGRPFGDTVFTFGMTVFETLLMRRVLRDVNAQPTVFHRDFYQTWAGDAPNDFALDLFVYYSAKHAGLNVKRVPVRFETREHGQSHWNVDFASKLKFIRRTVDFSTKLRCTL